LDEERDAHHRQVQALMALLGQSQQLQLAPPVEAAGDVAVEDGGGEHDPVTSQTQNGAAPAGQEAQPWWRRAWGWLATG
jgi:hypothetical protein